MNLLLFSATTLLLITAQRCQKPAPSPICYKGRLAIKAICSNYTISVVEGAMDTAKLVANWTDEQTGKTYKNAFALGNPCSFPTTLAEGQEFYFTLSSNAETCAVCEAYYPKPAKALSITVLNKPCP